MRITNRGWLVIYAALALVSIAFLAWAEATWVNPDIDHARIDAEQLQ